jgi:hypothetical protein
MDGCHDHWGSPQIQHVGQATGIPPPQTLEINKHEVQLRDNVIFMMISSYHFNIDTKIVCTYIYYRMVFCCSFFI